MQAALQEFIVHGVLTNIDFLQAVLSHPDFANGKVTTGWVERNLESDGFPSNPHEQAPALHIIAAALADFAGSNRKSEAISVDEPDPYSPWKTASGFRIGGNHG
jgi:pyruvate carboxylase